MSYTDRQKYAGKNRLASSRAGSGTRPVERHDRYTETVAGARQWNEAQYAQHNQRRYEWYAQQYQNHDIDPCYAPTAGGDSSHKGHYGETSSSSSRHRVESDSTFIMGSKSKGKGKDKAKDKSK